MWKRPVPEHPGRGAVSRWRRVSAEDDQLGRGPSEDHSQYP